MVRPTFRKKKWAVKAIKMNATIQARKRILEEGNRLPEPTTVGPRIVNNPIQIEIYTSENTPDKSIEGRRIIDISYFYSKLQAISKHGPMDCGLACIEIVGERQVGLHSKFTLKCKMCQETFCIENDAPDGITINDSAVAGTIAIGCGHSQLQEFSAALNLPMMTFNTYKASHSKISDHWEKIAFESMTAAAQKEREMAIKEGRIDKNGVPIIDVTVDGCWSKRTYKKNYSALSGAAAIIGRKTGEVLFLGVKNKYCSICEQAQTTNKEPKDHKCYKNFRGPSTAMESEILVEGFKCSIAMHNLIYGRMISDGDSSTYSKLLKSRPYPHITIEKIECRNHILRNFCNKFAALQTDKKYLLKFRKIVTQRRILTLRKTIRKIISTYTAATESERKSNIEMLHHDLLLAHLHAFDNHAKCKTYFCDLDRTKPPGLENDFYLSTLWTKICLLMSTLAAHSPSLIHDIDSNTVERFNSIIAKLVGGKRVNYSLRGSYQARCQAAVVSFNTQKVLSSVFKSIAGHSPRGSIKKFETNRKKKLIKTNLIPRKKNRKLISKGEDMHYGDKCEKPDMLPHIFEEEKETFLRNLVKTKAEKQKIERATVLQSSCSEWLELRRNILTASNFGKIIKRRNNISCQNLVRDILYKDSIAHVKAIKHGKDNEKKGLSQLEKQENVKILACGLHIDEKCHFLGATPDGIIDNDTIVELKCPITVYNKDITDVVKNKKLPFYKMKDNNELVMNRTHNWFYQVQGQLNITNKQKCLFAICCGENFPLKTEIIVKDEIFWKNTMKPKLVQFYTECLLPELIDPRFPRNMKIRDPLYIQEAIRKKEEKRESRKRKHTGEQSVDQEYEEQIIEKENEEIYLEKEIQTTRNIPLNKNHETVDQENVNAIQLQELPNDFNVPVLMERNYNTDNVPRKKFVRELKFNEL